MCNIPLANKTQVKKAHNIINSFNTLINSEIDKNAFNSDLTTTIKQLLELRKNTIKKPFNDLGENETLEGVSIFFSILPLFIAIESYLEHTSNNFRNDICTKILDFAKESQHEKEATLKKINEES